MNLKKLIIGLEIGLVDLKKLNLLLTTFLKSFERFPLSKFERDFLLQDGWNLQREHIIRGDTAVQYDTEDVKTIRDCNSNPRLWLHLQDAAARSFRFMVMILEDQVRELEQDSDHWPQVHPVTQERIADVLDNFGEIEKLDFSQIPAIKLFLARIL